MSLFDQIKIFNIMTDALKGIYTQIYTFNITDNFISRHTEVLSSEQVESFMVC